MFYNEFPLHNRLFSYLSSGQSNIIQHSFQDPFKHLCHVFSYNAVCLGTSNFLQIKSPSVWLCCMTCNTTVFQLLILCHTTIIWQKLWMFWLHSPSISNHHKCQFLSSLLLYFISWLDVTFNFLLRFSDSLYSFPTWIQTFACSTLSASLVSS